MNFVCEFRDGTIYGQNGKFNIDGVYRTCGK